METQLREIKQKCISASTTETMSSGPSSSGDATQVKEVANTMISGLQKLMLAAS